MVTRTKMSLVMPDKETFISFEDFEASASICLFAPQSCMPSSCVRSIIYDKQAERKSTNLCFQGLELDGFLALRVERGLCYEVFLGMRRCQP